MVKYVSEMEFVDGFKDDKGNLINGFTFEGLKVLYDYFLELEDDLGEPIQFDPVGVRCEFTEYESPLDVVNDYGLLDEDDRMDYEALDDEDDQVSMLMDLIDAKTTSWLLYNGGVIIRAF